MERFSLSEAFKGCDTSINLIGSSSSSTATDLISQWRLFQQIDWLPRLNCAKKNAGTERGQHSEHDGRTAGTVRSKWGWEHPQSQWDRECWGWGFSLRSRLLAEDIKLWGQLWFSAFSWSPWIIFVKNKTKKLAVCATISHDNVRINLPQLSGREGCRGNQQSDRGETPCTWILRSLWCSFPKASLAWQKTCTRRYEGWTGLSCGREPIAKRGHNILWKRMSNDKFSPESWSRNSCSNSE